LLAVDLNAARELRLLTGEPSHGVEYSWPHEHEYPR
jgi:hypothetical protein